MPIQRRLVTLLGAIAFALVTAAPALACEPYTWAEDQDGYRLSHGVQWAFSGVVVEEEPNPEVPDRPSAVVLEVDETFVGDVSQSRLRIEQDAGCDGFWYQTGDHVIAAIGRGPGLTPPFSGISNYQVAVWVIRDGTVDATIRAPWIGGRSPRTERQLRAELGALPDTATVDGATAPTMRSPAVPLLAMAAILTGFLSLRRRQRTDLGSC
jgi:hypothetical protein